MKSGGLKRLICAVAVAVVGVGAVGTGRALAHASLESSTPAASSVLEASPPLISLNFDEAIEVSLTSIQLFNEKGKVLPVGSAVSGADDSIVQSSVATVPDGTYAVVWRVTSADGHVVDGAFSFQVGSGSGVDSARLIDSVLSGSRAAPAVGRVMGIARFASFLAASLLLGGLFMVMMAHVEAQHGWATRRLLWLGLVLLGLASFANFTLLGAKSKAGTLADAFDMWKWVDIAGTRTGVLLIVRLALTVLLIPVVACLNRRQRAWWPISVALLGLLTIFTFSGAGHPSVTDQPAIWMAVDALHLGFVAVWLGSLVMMAVGGRTWLRDPRHVPAVKSFSRMATVGIPVIVVTGVAQTWRLGGSLTNLTDTSWGRILLAKVAIAVLMVTIGAASRWLLSHEGPAGLRRMVLAEAVCGIAVLGLAAGLVAQPPTVGPRSKVFTAALTENGTIADVSITPGRVGANEFHLVITPAGGSIKPVVSVTARMSLPARNMPNTPVTLITSGPNHYTGNITLPFSGDWTLELVIEPTAGESVLLTSAVPIP